jgi:putative two-component system response regulator
MSIQNALDPHPEAPLEQWAASLYAKIRPVTMEASLCCGDDLKRVRQLAEEAEVRHRAFGNHILRVAMFSRVIAKSMGMSADFCDDLLLAAPLHDVGKIEIPQSILCKPGPLTLEERTVVQTHCEIGARILRQEQAHCRSANSRALLELAASIAASHHERWDGTGYPYRLEGHRIPIEGRIVAIADVFDALRSSRPYKGPVPTQEALGIIMQGCGTHFDPAVVWAFRKSLPEILGIEARLSDCIASL